mmetsp:Transcript_13400/g.32849  ORF Transcript_13400/g.32849 Transcript_13400/m.32849 type:complete len:265 (-) Transcript_13400:245-1039(-)
MACSRVKKLGHENTASSATARLSITPSTKMSSWSSDKCACVFVMYSRRGWSCSCSNSPSSSGANLYIRTQIAGLLFLKHKGSISTSRRRSKRSFGRTFLLISFASFTSGRHCAKVRRNSSALSAPKCSAMVSMNSFVWKNAAECVSISSPMRSSKSASTCSSAVSRSAATFGMCTRNASAFPNTSRSRCSKVTGSELAGSLEPLWCTTGNTEVLPFSTSSGSSFITTAFCSGVLQDKTHIFFVIPSPWSRTSPSVPTVRLGLVM